MTNKEILSCKNVPTADAAATTAFDYSGLDKQTVSDLHLAEREYAAGKRLAEIGLHRMADGVAIAHEALVPNWDKRSNQYSEDTFRRWCESIGISKSAAYRLLQVTTLFDNSSPEQQKILDSLSPSLLYAAAKPSAPANLVQAVKDGDITTHKQYQELLKENQQLRADRVSALNAAQAAEHARDAALADVNGLHEQNKKLCGEKAEAERQLDGARQVAEAAKMRADKWQKEVEAAKAQPVEAVVDEEEIDRRAHKLAADLTAPLREELDALKARPAADTTEDDLRNAYDSLLLVGRSMQNAWKSVKPQLQKLPADTRAGAINQLNNTLTEIQTEAIKCL